MGSKQLWGDHSSHALWHVMSEGRQQGLQGESSQKLEYATKMEAIEEMLEVENLLQECGQAHNACLRRDYDKQLDMKESFEILAFFSIRGRKQNPKCGDQKIKEMLVHL